jgi:hypothetical protein
MMTMAMAMVMARSSRHAKHYCTVDAVVSVLGPGDRAAAMIHDDDETRVAASSSSDGTTTTIASMVRGRTRGEAGA